MIEAPIVLPNRHPAQEQVVRERSRFNVPAMGRRWGKSTLCLDLLIADPGWCALDGYPVAWMAATSKIFDEVWRLTLSTLPPEAIRRTDQQKHRIELVTDGVIDFWSLDNADRRGPGRGRKYRRVVIDEAAFVPDLLNVWSKSIRPTLIDYTGDAWFPSTPNGINNDYHTLWLRGQSGSKNWASWQMPSHTNPHLSRSELDDIKAEYAGRPLDYRQEVLAEFVSDGGSVFKSDTIIDAKPPAGIERRVLGIDLAFTEDERNDETAMVEIGKWTPGKGMPPQYHILWVDAAHRSIAGSVARILETVKARRLRWVRCEGGPSGKAIEPFMRERMRQEDVPLFNFDLVTHMRDKIAKAAAMVAAVGNGMVYADKSAPWWPKFLDEMLMFDGKDGRQDNRVDAAAIALREIDSLQGNEPEAQSAAEAPPRSIAARDAERARVEAATKKRTNQEPKRMWRR
jgi:predicted phage terminase large subunit-like protein